MKLLIPVFLLILAGCASPSPDNHHSEKLVWREDADEFIRSAINGR